MMTAWAVGWQELVILLLLLVLPGLGGLALFVVGLSLKKPVMWGIGLGLIALVLLMVLAAAALFVLA